LTVDKFTLDKARLLNRKAFLRLATSAVAAAFIIIWYLITGRQKQLSETPVVNRIDTAKLGTGIFIFDNFILVKSDNGVKVFSNRCTHAGCRINHEINGELVCPCHGSKYEAATGRVIQGPADHSLPQIPLEIDEKTGEIIIKI